MGTGFEPVYTDLQSVASPLGQPTGVGWVCRDPLRADDEARTRDLNLGKVVLYQLSYVRLLSATDFAAVEVRENRTRCVPVDKLGVPRRLPAFVAGGLEGLDQRSASSSVACGGFAARRWSSSHLNHRLVPLTGRMRGCALG